MLSTSHKKIYPAASVDDAVKTALAELYLVQAKNGMTRVAFRADMTCAGIVLSKAQFDRHVAAVEAGGTAISSEKGSGRPVKLTEQQQTILWGWVLAQNLGNHRVDLAGFCASSQELFGVSLSMASASTRTFVQESDDLLRRFFAYNDIPKETMVLSDCGNAFGSGVLEDLGFSRHAQYPPAVHQYLSPNDNNLHGAAKQLWRQSRVDFRDDVSSSLLLLNLLDKQTVAHSKFWFERNMLNLTKDGAASLIFGAGERVSDLAKERLRAYRVFVNEDGSDWEPD